MTLLDETQLAVDVAQLLDTPGAAPTSGALNIIEGFQTGEPVQVAGGATQMAGAYVQYQMAQAHQRALDAGASAADAALAAQNVDVGGGLTTGAVADWLPWIGFGLSAAQLAENPSREGAFNLGSSVFAYATSNPLMMVPAVLGGAISWRHSEHASKKKHYVHWYTPTLEKIHQDEEGWVYLYDSKQVVGTSHQHDPDQPDGGGTFIRYNPETNEMERASIQYLAGSRPSTRAASRGFQEEEFKSLTSEESVRLLGGQDLQLETTFYDRGPRSEQRPGGQHMIIPGGERGFVPTGTKPVTVTLGWKTFDPNCGYDSSGDPIVYNMESLQSQIYNKVLVPEGFAPAPSVESGWEAVGDHLVGPGGEIATAGGELIGRYNAEGAPTTFNLAHDSSRIHKSDGRVEEMAWAPLEAPAPAPAIAAGALEPVGEVATGLPAEQEPAIAAGAIDDSARVATRLPAEAQMALPEEERWKQLGEFIDNMLRAPIATVGSGRTHMAANKINADRVQRTEQAIKAQDELRMLRQEEMKNIAALERANVVSASQEDIAHISTENEMNRLLLAGGLDILRDATTMPDGQNLLIKWGGKLLQVPITLAKTALDHLNAPGAKDPASTPTGTFTGQDFTYDEWSPGLFDVGGYTPVSGDPINVDIWGNENWWEPKDQSTIWG